MQRIIGGQFFTADDEEGTDGFRVEATSLGTKFYLLNSSMEPFAEALLDIGDTRELAGLLLEIVKHQESQVDSR